MEYSGQPAESDIESGMARGKKLMDNAYKPRYAQQTGTPETRDRLMSALLGFRSGFEEAGKYIQQGNPIAATIAGISGGLTGPTPQTVATQRFQNEQQAQAAQFAMTPLFQVSPLLAKENPEFAEMPMAEFGKYAPTLEKLHNFENKLKEIEARGIEARKTGEANLQGKKELEIFKGFERDVPVTDAIKQLYESVKYPEPTEKLISREELAAISKLAGIGAKPSSSMLSDRGTPQWNMLIDKAGQGQIIGDDIFKGMGQAEARKAFTEDLLTKYPDYNPGIQLTRRRELFAQATLSGGRQARAKQAAAAVEKNMQELSRVIESLGSAKVQQITGLIRQGQAQFDETKYGKDANKLFALLRTTAYEEAFVETGGYAPQVGVQEEMLKSFSQKLGSQGFAGVWEAINITNQNRLAAQKFGWQQDSDVPRKASNSEWKTMKDGRQGWFIKTDKGWEPFK